MIFLDTLLATKIPVIDWCLPPEMLLLKDGRPHPSLQRCRFAIAFGLLIGPLLLSTAILRLVTGTPMDATLLTVLCSALIAMLMPIQFRWTGWMKPMVGYYIIASLVVFPVRVVAMGGLQSMVMVWAIAPALLGAQLGGMRLALLSTLMVIAEIFGIYHLQTNGMVQTTAPSPLGEAATVVRVGRERERSGERGSLLGRAPAHARRPRRAQL